MDNSITITWQANLTTDENTISGMGLVWFDGTEGTRHQIGLNKWEALAPNAEISFHRGDVICCYNHDFAKILGRQKNNTLQLQQTEKGVLFNATLNPLDPEHQSIKAKIDRGDIYGCSATFRPLNNTWSEDETTMLYDRIELVEIGPVVKEAMTAATIAASESNNSYSLALYETKKRLKQL